MKRIGYQGIVGSYSETVVSELINNSEAVPFKKFRDIFINIENDNIDYGLIPIENNLGGSLHINYDLLNEYNYKIIMEYNYPIDHCLIIHPKTNFANIKKVISHYQAISQCTNFIKEHNLISSESFDTAGSVRLIAESECINTGCIASQRAAELYGMEIVKEKIQNNKINLTRF